MARLPTVLAFVLLLAPGALAQANDTNATNGTDNQSGDPDLITPATGDPPYRATGQAILYLTVAAIGAGLVGTWWVNKKYEP